MEAWLLWIFVLLIFSVFYWGLRRYVKGSEKVAGHQPTETTDQRISQLKARCEEDEVKLELVSSLEYWLTRKSKLTKNWRNHRELKECEQSIAKYEGWIEEEGIKPKVLPPPKPEGNTSVRPAYEPPELYGVTTYEKQRVGSHEAVILDANRLKSTQARILQYHHM